MNIEAIGKRLLFFSFAITCALFISLKLLQATTVHDEYDAKGRRPVLVDDLGFGNSVDAVVENARELLGVQAVKKPLNDPDVQTRLAALPGDGKAVAYLLNENLYGIDKHCRLLGLADSLAFADLPVISVNNPLVRLDNFTVCESGVKKAVALIKAVNKNNPSLAAALSEISVDDELGLIGYFGWGSGVFVIFGKEMLGEKLLNLNSFYVELGNTKLMEVTRSLDLRYGDKIIVKKKSV